MKLIKKSNQPTSLTQYTQQNRNNAKYGNLDKQTKEDLQESLLKEQGYICCYCMKPISQDKMRIEHWLPQSASPLQTNPLLTLNYSNLLAACQGGEGGSKYQYHCDKSKGNKLITLHPQKKINLSLPQGQAIGTSCEILVKFKRDGRVYSQNPKIDKELNEILCLNNQKSIESRLAALDQFRKDLQKKYPGKWKKETLERWLDIYSNKSGEKYKPYCRVIISFLEKSLKKCS